MWFLNTACVYGVELIVRYILWYHTCKIYSDTEKFVGFEVSHPHSVISMKSYKHERDNLSYPINKQSKGLEQTKYKTRHAYNPYGNWWGKKGYLHWISCQNKRQLQQEGGKGMNFAREWNNYFEEDLLFIMYLNLKTCSYVVLSLKAGKKHIFLFIVKKNILINIVYSFMKAVSREAINVGMHLILYLCTLPLKHYKKRWT